MLCKPSVANRINESHHRYSRGVLLIAIAFLFSHANTGFSQSAAAAKTAAEHSLAWQFATVAQGQALLSKEDEFIQRLSPFDRQARLKTSKTISKTEHLEFTSECVRPWSEEDQEKLRPVLKQVKQRLAEIPLPLPREILLIKTNGEEEGQAPYTRGNAIVVPAKRLGAESVQSLKSLLFHELFHIASRADHMLRDELYKVIGFEKCGELTFPKSLLRRKLTNPDAPVLQHCIEVSINGQNQWVVPVIYANAESYDEDKGGEFFQYLTFELLVVQRDSETGRLSPTPDSKPVLVSPRTANGFMAKIGANTRYIIHPEEILADNFALLATGDGKIRTPGITDRMKAILQARR